MIKEYKEYKLEGRSDFRVEEVSENLTIFLFNQKYFRVCKREMEGFVSLLQESTNGAVVADFTKYHHGVLTMLLNPTLTHFTSDSMKNAIIKFFFDHRIKDKEGFYAPT